MNTVQQISETKQIVRIAEVRGVGIRKRCRKQEHIFCEGIGLTEEEALANLNASIKKKISELKVYEFEGNVHIADGERTRCMYGNSIMRPMRPEWTPHENNYKSIPWSAATREWIAS